MSSMIKHEGFTDQQVDLIKTTICKGASDDQLHLFLYTCKRMGLDPFAKQIYAVLRNDKKSGGKVMSIQTSIDGFRLIAERTGRYAPGREPTYVYNEKDGKVISATSYVRKQTQDGTWHEVAACAYIDEYAQRDWDGKLNSFWEKMPRVMLAKVAESLALRRAFPAELSGVHTEDEMAQADKETDPLDVQAVKIDTKEKLEKKLEDKVKNAKKINDQQLMELEDELHGFAGLEKEILAIAKINDLKDMPDAFFIKAVSWISEQKANKAASLNEETGEIG